MMNSSTRYFLKLPQKYIVICRCVLKFDKMNGFSYKNDN